MGTSTDHLTMGARRLGAEVPNTTNGLVPRGPSRDFRLWGFLAELATMDAHPIDGVLVSDLNIDDSARTGITVGLDGRPGSSAALRWAMARTSTFGPIRPVLAWHYPILSWLPEPFSGGSPSAVAMQSAAEAAAWSCVEDVDRSQRVDPIVREGDAGPILVDEARDSAVLVVGSRGRNHVLGRLLGSVGRYCADHTTTPLVIVPSTDEPSDSASSPTIDVGIDGSDHSELALRWAVAHSQPTDTITAHSSWQFVGGLGYEATPIEWAKLREATTAMLEQCVDRVCDDLGVPRTRVERRVEQGDPRSVLRTVADTSGLLVVGTRGRTGLPHLFLGSTTSALVHRPHCPIAIIPSSDRAEAML